MHYAGSGKFAFYSFEFRRNAERVPSLNASQQRPERCFQLGVARGFNFIDMREMNASPKRIGPLDQMGAGLADKETKVVMDGPGGSCDEVNFKLPPGILDWSHTVTGKYARAALW